MKEARRDSRQRGRGSQTSTNPIFPGTLGPGSGAGVTTSRVRALIGLLTRLCHLADLRALLGQVGNQVARPQCPQPPSRTTYPEGRELWRAGCPVALHVEQDANEAVTGWRQMVEVWIRQSPPDGRATAVGGPASSPRSRRACGSEGTEWAGASSSKRRAGWMCHIQA